MIPAVWAARSSSLGVHSMRLNGALALNRRVGGAKANHSRGLNDLTHSQLRHTGLPSAADVEFNGLSFSSSQIFVGATPCAEPRLLHTEIPTMRTLSTRYPAAISGAALAFSALALLACSDTETTDAPPVRAIVCGDGIIDLGEDCDNGADNSDMAANACRRTCVPADCGDGVVDDGETCDDGAANSDVAASACRTTCAPAGCGDGVVDNGETCDDGADNSDVAADACRTTCAPAECGDGVVDDGETCDDGAANSDVAASACRTTCAPAECGDGVIDDGETCDDGAANSATGPDACRVGCVVAGCGDGVRDTGEACDTGMLGVDDGCTDACTVDAAFRCDGGSPTVCESWNTPDSAASAQIAAARAGAATTLTGVAVSYMRPEIGEDGAGFFVQAQRQGPALYVDVDPATLDIDLAVGDIIELAVTVVSRQGRVVAISATNVTRFGSGYDVAALSQDVTNAPDLVSDYPAYGAELVAATATIEVSFGPSGVGFASAQAGTFGISGEDRLRIRLPIWLRQDLGLRAGCAVTIGPSPLWRHIAHTYLTAWASEDITVHSCPAPRLIGAEAPGATEVIIQFDRMIAAESLTQPNAQFAIDGLTVTGATVGNEPGNTTVILTTGSQEAGAMYSVTVASSVLDIAGGSVSTESEANVASFDGYAAQLLTVEATAENKLTLTFADGIAASAITAPATQFVLDGGLTAESAVVAACDTLDEDSGDYPPCTVVLTTSAQTPGVLYTVSVAESVKDVYGGSVESEERVQVFRGFADAASVRINEFNANVDDGCDLVELRVTKGGNMAGIKLRSIGTAFFGPLTIANFGQFIVQTDDLIVVHMKRGFSACNPGGATNETASKDHFPQAEYSRNYDSAYDFYMLSVSGLATPDLVLSLWDAEGEIIDMVAGTGSDECTNYTVGSVPEARVATGAAEGEWTTVDGDVPNAGFIDSLYCEHAVADIDDTGLLPSGSSIQRVDDNDMNDKSDWSDGQDSTFGALNPGQSPL
ncbi:MAG: cysteine-rich repeat protein [Myxococcota bacterium]